MKVYLVDDCEIVSHLSLFLCSNYNCTVSASSKVFAPVGAATTELKGTLMGGHKLVCVDGLWCKESKCTILATAVV